MASQRLGLLGASSSVGECLLPMLTQSGWQVVAYSRQFKNTEDKNLEWRLLSSPSAPVQTETQEFIADWICLAPIWVLPDYFDFLLAHGAKRVVALSSTSRFTKIDSVDPAEQAVAHHLAGGEAQLRVWAEMNGIDWAVVRPTMIYGHGKDKNVTEIARLIHRWGIFPLLGEGRGLRQPVHVEDVAKACQALITSSTARNRAYNLSGGEVLSYKEIVTRIFTALGKTPRFIHVPRGAFHLALTGLRLLPRFRHWSVAMADRMDRDMAFEHKQAVNDFGFSPRPFQLSRQDLP